MYHHRLSQRHQRFRVLLASSFFAPWCIVITVLLLLRVDVGVDGFSSSTSMTSASRRLFISASSSSSREGRQTPLVSLLSSSSSSSAEDEEERRMEMVRQLQKTFYQSTADDENDDENDDKSTTTIRFDNTTGRILNLPLWRVGWVEVPGRANCLNVHEGHYTNMFEKILSSTLPRDKWYFGHLHLPGGTKSARTKGENRFQLKTWQEEANDTNRFDETERSAVVGCLMRITDYRRLKDGRLVLLVHGLERFVVDEVVESFPHGVAHVQLLPDTDATIDNNMPSKGDSMDENFAKSRRADAVQRSFQYHNYECDPIPLPLPKDTAYMSQSDVIGVEIAKCLPFAYFAKDDSMLPQQKIDDDASAPNDDDETDDATTSFAGGQPPLEDLLQRDLILRNPPPTPGVKSQYEQDPDSLEKFLWLALEDFCRSSRFVLPEEILCLMPPEMDYLDLPKPKNGFRLSTKYPKSRRQWRLSYHVPALIENTAFGAEMRQIWLNTPSTQARLAAVLERFQAINESLMGQFQ